MPKPGSLNRLREIIHLRIEGDREFSKSGALKKWDISQLQQ